METIEKEEDEKIQSILEKLKKQWERVAENNFRLIEREKKLKINENEKESDKEIYNQTKEKI
tara:strand:+ start:368 stop:553 length:186 start_codon:yes stop_codon:yes gene_type:complete